VTLKLVPPSPPSPADDVRLRVKRMKRPDGMIQCNRCGGRTLLNTVNGAYIKNGRKTGGTKIDENVCADCWRHGIFSPMLPELRRIE
jgi:hypothetical protein